LHLFLSYILHNKLENFLKAICELMVSMSLKPDLNVDFGIYRFTYQIEDDLKENDQKGGDCRNFDFNKIVLF
jgi:hypothetical protein